MVRPPSPKVTIVPRELVHTEVNPERHIVLDIPLRDDKRQQWLHRMQRACFGCPSVLRDLHHDKVWCDDDDPIPPYKNTEEPYYNEVDVDPGMGYVHEASRRILCMKCLLKRHYVSRLFDTAPSRSQLRSTTDISTITRRPMCHWTMPSHRIDSLMMRSSNYSVPARCPCGPLSTENMIILCQYVSSNVRAVHSD